ncbi:MAG: PTS glucose transporter subunit IIA [Oscillospiraceae bacterium]|nr:PTS glucose transporter subunit IIA [Oscillospiraceae bacterium]
MDLMRFVSSAPIEILAPADGRVIPLFELEDEVFRDKIIGDGLAIEPSDGVFVAPVNGEVIHVAKTRHTVTIKVNDRISIMVHMGLDTVYLGSAAIKCFVSEGQCIKCGDVIAEMNLEEVIKSEKKILTPIILMGNKSAKLCKTDKIFVNKLDRLFTIS